MGLFAFDETCTQLRNSFSSSYSTKARSSLLSDRGESCGLTLRECSSECSHALNYVSLALRASWSSWYTSISKFYRDCL
jgi:hypothetical protein